MKIFQFNPFKYKFVSVPLQRNKIVETMDKLLTKSDKFNSEYCCSVVKIGELTPIEGSDFLAKTDILGTQIVVRKDNVHEGQIMFYAANETALNEKFLSMNNLFEIGCRDKNSNYPDIKIIMDEYDEKYKNEADKLREEAKGIKGNISKFTNDAAKANKRILKFKEELKSYENNEQTPKEGRVEYVNGMIGELKAKVDNATAKATALTTEYTTRKAKIEELVNNGKHIVDEAKKLCGFFNKYGRVRCIVLKGEPSFGFVFGVEEMAKYFPDILNESIEGYLGEDFDSVGGEVFVKVFVPPVRQEHVRKSRCEKSKKKLSRFDRLIDGEFRFHYDTEQFAKCISMFKPDTDCSISVKLHGTSFIAGRLRVKYPIPFKPLEKAWNWLMNKIFLGGILGVKQKYYIDYGPIYSSRKVIKNRYINPKVNSGYYSVDICNEYGDIVYPYLDNGMTVYGEIFGYETGTQKMIQKHYDYGCSEGENKIMFYRITTTNDDGSKREWEVAEVADWTNELVERMKSDNDENYKRIHTIDVLYSGTLGDLYPDIDTEQHWNEEFLNRIKNDAEKFGMECLEPLCTFNEVPREGLCFRINGSVVPSCWKLKTNAFRLKEALMTDAGEVDSEMLQGYSEESQTEEEVDNG